MSWSTSPTDNTTRSSFGEVAARWQLHQTFNRQRIDSVASAKYAHSLEIWLHYHPDTLKLCLHQNLDAVDTPGWISGHSTCNRAHCRRYSATLASRCVKYYRSLSLSSLKRFLGAMPFLKHLIIFTPKEKPLSPSSMISNTLVVIRLAVEQSKPPNLSSLTLRCTQPRTAQSLKPGMSVDTWPCPADCWRRIQELHIHLDDTVFSSRGFSFLRNYLQMFLATVENVTFHYRYSRIKGLVSLFFKKRATPLTTENHPWSPLRVFDGESPSQDSLKGATTDSRRLLSLIRTYLLPHPHFSFKPNDQSIQTTEVQHTHFPATIARHDFDPRSFGSQHGTKTTIITIGFGSPRSQPHWYADRLLETGEQGEYKNAEHLTGEDEKIHEVALAAELARRAAMVRTNLTETYNGQELAQNRLEDRLGGAWERMDEIHHERQQNCKTPLIGLEEGLWRIDDDFTLSRPLAVAFKESVTLYERLGKLKASGRRISISVKRYCSAFGSKISRDGWK